MALAHFRILIHELLNKDPEIVPEESPLIVLDSKSDMCMAKNSNYTKHTRHIARRMNFVRNGEKWKIHKIYWCEWGLQLADIGTKNVSEPDITPRIKYIMVGLETENEHLCKRGDRIQGYSMEQEFCMTRLNNFEWPNNIKTVYPEWKQCCSEWKQCWSKTMYK